MRRPILAIALASLGLLLLASPAAAATATEQRPLFADVIDVVADEPFLVPVAANRSVRVSFPVGELEVVAAAVDAVATELTVECGKLSATLCAKYRGRLRLEGRDRDGVVEVRLVGLHKWKLRKLHLEGRVTVPQWAPLEVRVGVGDIDVFPGERDLAVTMGVGDLTVRVPHDRVRSVHSATRIGDASLRGEITSEGARRMLLGARLDWVEGPGTMDIALGLRIGDSVVVLE